MTDGEIMILWSLGMLCLFVVSMGLPLLGVFILSLLVLAIGVSHV